MASPWHEDHTTDRTRITRHAERQSCDIKLLHQILDEGLIAHVAILRDGYPVVLPMTYARDGDSLLVHGSTGGGLLRAAAEGREIALTVTIVDGLVYAASLFDSSMNYRSVMVIGCAVPLDAREKLRAVEVLAQHVMPGRVAEVRPSTTKELAATQVLRLSLDEASIKVRTGPPAAPNPQQSDGQAWSGVVPVTMTFGLPIRAPDVPAGIQVPASVKRLGIARP